MVVGVGDPVLGVRAGLPRLLIRSHYVPRYVPRHGRKRVTLYRRGLVATWAMLALAILGSPPGAGANGSLRLSDSQSAGLLSSPGPAGAGGAGGAGEAGVVGGAVEAAGRQVGSDHWAGSAPSATSPDPADSATELYRAAAAHCPGLRWEVLAAIARVETNGGQRVTVSTAGALGPMQFLPATWAAYRPNVSASVTNLADAAAAAARLLCANGAPNHLRNALWNYNHSPAYADQVFAMVASIQGAGRYPF